MELRDINEINIFPKNMLNLECFILKDNLFKISAIEKKINIPASILQKHLKRKRRLPYHYFTKLEILMVKYGYNRNIKYYTDEDYLNYPINYIIR